MRQGFVLPAMLMSAGAASLLVVAIIGATVSRAREARLHQARVQGREWCLGARTMANPGVVEIGAWQVSIDAAHSASASGPLGTYRIAADGHESWSRRP
jgi:hypothetical protein